MKKRDLTLEVNLDVRILVTLLAIGILLFGVTSSGAAGDDTPNINDATEQPALAEGQPEVMTVPDKPAGMGDVVYTTNDEWVPRESIDQEPDAAMSIDAISAATGTVRHFYATKSNYSTNHTLTACASGYRMASLWEILDVSNLIYDYTLSAAATKADDGHGPPSYWNGWVRTGYDNSNSSTTGTGNCKNWSSVSASDHGVSVRLSRTWETAPGDIGVWDATSFTCNYDGPVWCVKG